MDEHVPPTISQVIAQLESIRAEYGDLPVVIRNNCFAQVGEPDIEVWDTDWTDWEKPGPMRKVVSLNGSY